MFGNQSARNPVSVMFSPRRLHAHRVRSARQLALQPLEDRTPLSADLAWAVGIGSGGFDQADRLATDPEGNVYATGLFSGTVDFDPGSATAELSAVNERDTFVAKYDRDGKLLWAKAFGATGDSGGRGIAVDAAGNVFVTGGFLGTIDLDPGSGVVSLTSAGGDDIFLVKLDGAGNFVWGNAIGGPATGDQSQNLAVDADGNVFVVGFFRGTVDFDPGPHSFLLSATGSLHDAFIWKLDSDGNFVRAAAFSGDGIDVANGIAVDPSGGVWVAGNFGASGNSIDVDPGPETVSLDRNGGQDAFLVRLDSNWNLSWAGRLGGPGDDGMHGNPATDAEGSVYITGGIRGMADFSFGSVEHRTATTADGDPFVLKVDSSGNLQWVQTFAGNGGGFGVAVDGFGDVYASGTFRGTVDVDPGIGTFSLTSAGGTDGYVAKLDTDGALIWAGVAPQGPSDGDGASPIALGATHDIYIAGGFRGTADLDPSSDSFYFTSKGGLDGFVYKLTQGQAVQIDVKPGSDPNDVNVDSEGVIAVAVFTTADFDASRVDAASVVFAGAAAFHNGMEDVDGDGDLDMVLHFRTQETNLRHVYEQLLIDDADEDGVLDSTRQDAEVSLTGQTLDETLFEGVDTMDLFLAGKALRSLLDDLAAAGVV